MLQLFRLKRPAVAGAAHCGFRGGRWLALAGLACLCALPARAITSSLGTGTRLEGPAAGGDSVELAVTPASGTWTATANDAWLHLNTPSQSGTGGTNVFFSYEANPGATRTGTLTIAGLTVTVTQAGGTYAPVSAVTTLASSAAGLNSPSGVAVDGAGNLYIVDQGNNAVYELPAGSTNLITLANPASGLNYPFGVAVDTAGDVYITDPGKHAVYELPAGGTALTTLVSSGLSTPYGVAVDGAGNLYIADAGKHAVYELPAGGTTLTTLANSASGLSQPFGVAVDWLRNVYISDAGSQAVYELPAGGTSLTTLATAASGLAYPYTLAVDGAGNLYIGEDGSQTIYELPAGGTGLIPVVSSGLSYPYGVAVDGAGNLYIANAGNSTVGELPHALVVPTARVESAEAGSDNLPMVVPATANLSGVLARVSEFPWLTITGTAGGVVSFSFTANPGGDRIGYIELLGQFIAVLQGGTPSQGTTALVEGPAGGSDSVTLAINPGMGTWTATANDSWLHINPVTASGIGSTNVLFRYDPNPGATRTGSLTVNGLTVTVTQAGSTYAPITALTTLASSVSGLSAPTSVAVDGSGNVYIADQQNDAIYELPAGGTTLTTLADNASGLGQPAGVAVDGSGNVYITDEYNQTVFELPAGGTTLITLANGSSGLSQPEGVAVDGSGNIYIADAGTPAVYELPAGGTGLTTLANSASGLSHPFGVAVDVAGNVYISDVGNQAVYELPNGGATLTPLVSSGLSQPYGVAVDGSGNVLIADAVGAVYELPAGGTTVTTLANSSSGLISAYGVVVDGAGNVLIADQGGEAAFPQSTSCRARLWSQLPWWKARRPEPTVFPWWCPARPI
jgi:sugar lactone lactonase YvrE